MWYSVGMNDQEKQSYIAHLKVLEAQARERASNLRLYNDDPLNEYHIGEADGLRTAITLLEKT